MEDITQARPAATVPDIKTRQTAMDVLYTPQGVQRSGVGGWQIMFQELVESRRLIWLLILRDLSVRYRQSILGYVWAVVPQIATIAVFAFLNSSRVLPIGGTKIPYVAYSLWGMSVWQLFAGCLTNCANSLTASGSLVTKINFPREALVIAALGQPAFDFVVRLVPVVAVFIWCGVVPPWQSLFMPLFLLPVVVLGLGLGFVLSIANLVIRDTANALGTALTIAMFLTPVLYPPPVRWPFYLINVLNPLSPLVAASQDLIAGGFLTQPEMFIAACIFSTALFLASWRAFRITILRVIGYA
jgi:lipopolysaccharide transport system permease protein